MTMRTRESPCGGHWRRLVSRHRSLLENLAPKSGITYSPRRLAVGWGASSPFPSPARPAVPEPPGGGPAAEGCLSADGRCEGHRTQIGARRKHPLSRGFIPSSPQGMHHLAVGNVHGIRSRRETTDPEGVAPRRLERSGRRSREAKVRIRAGGLFSSLRGADPKAGSPLL